MILPSEYQCAECKHLLTACRCPAHDEGPIDCTCGYSSNQQCDGKCLSCQHPPGDRCGYCPDFGKLKKQNMGQMIDVVEQRETMRPYGDPVETHQKIARILNILSHPHGGKHGAIDAAMHQVVVKLVRLSRDPMHADSALDIQGYGRIIQQCQDELRTLSGGA